jgi:hypothetical protein
MNLFKLIAFVAFVLAAIFILAHVLPLAAAALIPAGLALYVLGELAPTAVVG